MASSSHSSSAAGLLTLPPPPPPFPAQPPKEEARGCTREEFKSVLACVAAQLREEYKKGRLAELPTWLSFDNPSIHNLRDEDFPAGFHRVPLSKYSPDIHKVIEHTFARWKTEVHGLIYRECVLRGITEPSILQLQSILERALATVTKPATIAADQATLPVTLRMIATAAGQEFTMPDGRQYSGTGGNWAREHWR